MGVDIFVWKIKKASREDKKNNNYIELISKVGEKLTHCDHGMPNSFNIYKTKMQANWFDWEEYKKRTGFDINCIDSMWWPNSDTLRVEYMDDGEWVEKDISEKDIPTFKVKYDIVGREEIGYQRKGLNEQFYNDYDEADPDFFCYLWTKEDVEKFKNKYAEDKMEFKTNIEDHFIEGETCVFISW